MTTPVNTYQTDRQKLGVNNTNLMIHPSFQEQNDRISLMLSKLDSIAEQNSQYSTMILRDIYSLSNDIKKIKETNKLYITGIVMSALLTGIALVASATTRLP